MVLNVKMRVWEPCFSKETFVSFCFLNIFMVNYCENGGG